MAITYPLSIPAENEVRTVEMRTINTVAVSSSPFSLDESRYSWGGEMWQADVTLKPMRRSDAEKWAAFLTSLRGQFGTFLMGDPYGCAPQGTATTATITGTLGDRSVAATLNGSLLAGDYFQMGSGSNAVLYKVLQDRASSGTLEIWPALRNSHSSASAVLSNPKGVFRLASSELVWSVNELAIYGFSFAAVEVI